MIRVELNDIISPEDTKPITWIGEGTKKILMKGKKEKRKIAIVRLPQQQNMKKKFAEF